MEEIIGYERNYKTNEDNVTQFLTSDYKSKKAAMNQEN